MKDDSLVLFVSMAMLISR